MDLDLEHSYDLLFKYSQEESFCAVRCLNTKSKEPSVEFGQVDDTGELRTSKRLGWTWETLLGVALLVNGTRLRNWSIVAFNLDGNLVSSFLPGCPTRPTPRCVLARIEDATTSPSRRTPRATGMKVPAVRAEALLVRNGLPAEPGSRAVGMWSLSRVARSSLLWFTNLRASLLWSTNLLWFVHLKANLLRFSHLKANLLCFSHLKANLLWFVLLHPNISSRLSSPASGPHNRSREGTPRGNHAWSLKEDELAFVRSLLWRVVSQCSSCVCKHKPSLFPFALQCYSGAPIHLGVLTLPYNFFFTWSPM